MYYFQFSGKYYCKASPNFITVRNGSKLNIRFHSDGSINFRGFKARITQEQGEDKLHGLITHKCTWFLLQSLTVPLKMEDVHMYVLPMALLEGASVMPDMNYWMMEFPVEVS